MVAASSSKRMRRGGGVSAASMARLRAVTRPLAVQLLERLDMSTPLGLGDAKRGALSEQLRQFKAAHAERLVFLRVGEFYEVHGTDAVLVLDACATCEAHRLEAKVSVHANKLQLVLNALLRAAFSAAIFEESAVICTPRHRYLTQIVSMAAPLYALSDSVDDAPSALPIVGVQLHPDGAVSVCAVHVQERVCRKFVRVCESHARAMVARCCRPVYVLRDVPSWLRRDDVKLLGGAVHTDLADRVLDAIEADQCLPREQVRIVPATTGRCAPLARCTLQQLGLVDNLAVPSLVDHCLPRVSTASEREQLIEWFASPPSEATTQCNRAVLRYVAEATTPLPTFDAAPRGRRCAALQAGREDARVLLGVRANLVSTLELCAAWSDGATALLRTIAGEHGLDEAAVDIGALQRTLAGIESHVETAYDVLDARGASFRIVAHVSRAKPAVCDALAAVAAANTALDEHLAQWTPGETIRDARGVALRGRADGAAKLPVHDRNGRCLPNQYTTLELQARERAVAESVGALADLDAASVRACVRDMQAPEAFGCVCLVETVAVRVATLVAHATAALHKGWTAPSAAIAVERFDVQRLVPYWMDQTTCVVNPIALDAGAIVVLTAPNGGGKTTLLRALGAAMLLHQCGLMTPCSSASLPIVDALFLRSGAMDATLERRSAFAAEMSDLRAIMEAPGNVVALVDEPCRGTSTQDGIALLGAILRHLPARTTAIVSTHYHELATESMPRIVRWQLGARIEDEDCVPTYRLTPGTCTQSLALRVAVAVGLPIDVIHAARRTEDVETLLLAIFREGKTEFHRLDARRQTPPPEWPSTLYVIDTVDGVYVGESDRIVQRLRAHEREKPTIRAAYVTRCADKSAARASEAMLIRELRFRDVTLLSDADAVHRV